MPTPSIDLREIAFVGLGSMGLPMASRLVAAGYRVRGYDMREAARDQLGERGGVGCATLDDAARGAQALVLMVVNAKQARDVLFQASALAALSPDAVVLLMATCPPREVEELAREVEETGRRFVDCPVSGGVVGATAGTLTIMAAAPGPIFDAVRPLLEAMGQRLFHVGERPGQGAGVKAVNQLLCGIHLAAAGEALSLGERMGVDTAVLLDIVSSSAAGSWMLNDRGPRMLEEEPLVTSAVDIFVKDLGIALSAGRDAHADLPLARTAHSLFVEASEAGEGLRDDSRVIAASRRRHAAAGSRTGR